MGPGPQGHRILRRVPDDGRHPGPPHACFSRSTRKTGLGSPSPFLPQSAARARKKRAGSDKDVRSAMGRGAVGTKHPRGEIRASLPIRGSDFGRVKRCEIPGVSLRSPDSEGIPRGESRTRNREHARCGYTQFVWVAEVDRRHLRIFFSVGSQGPVGTEGASRKETRSFA